MFKRKQEIKEILAVIDKTADSTAKVAGKVLEMAVIQNTMVDNQAVFHTEIKRLGSELRQVKNELASVQVFLMDKVIQREE